jgi:hypothetical protein
MFLERNSNQHLTNIQRHTTRIMEEKNVSHDLTCITKSLKTKLTYIGLFE